MANNIVQVSIRVRHDLATNWLTTNPILAAGEFGLETDTLKLKIGNGSANWGTLPYIASNNSGSSNTFDSSYFTTDTNGNITLVGTFVDSLIQKDANGIVNNLRISTPVANNSAVNKQYVDDAVATIASAGHLRREIVEELPLSFEADSNTIYMMYDSSAQGGTDRYKEYMLINGVMSLIGDTSIDLKKLLSSLNPVAGNVVSIANDGSLIDSGYEASRLGIATTLTLGVVKSGTGVLGDGGVGIDRVVVDNSGFMTLSHVSTSLLYVPAGDTLILDGGAS